MKRRTYGRRDGSKKKQRIILLSIIAALVAGGLIVLLATGRRGVHPTEEETEVVVEDTVYRYGLPIEYFSLRHDTVAPNQTLAELLMGYGLSASKVYALTSHCPDSVFDVRKVRAGRPCILLSDLDSAATPRYFV